MHHNRPSHALAHLDLSIDRFKIMCLTVMILILTVLEPWIMLLYIESLQVFIFKICCFVKA